MGRFAWRNLMTRPLRTALALIGLSVPILGVIGLFSLSGGLRDLVGNTLSKVKGVMVMRENVPSPVFSILPSDDEQRLRSIPGIRVVAPEVWNIAPPVNGTSTFSKALGSLGSGGSKQMLGSILDMPLVQGQDIPSHHNLRSGVYPTAIKEKGEGRFLDSRDIGTNHIVISRKLSKQFPINGRPSGLGDTLTMNGKPFEIIGIYDTGSMLLDVVIVMDIGTARELLKVSKDNVSTFYVEMDDPTQNDAISQTIEAKIPGVDARGMNEFLANFGQIMGQLDTFLLMTVSLALLVGIVGIVNTMLMSTTERFVEFGVLRTNGWSRSNVLSLVTTESAMLGLIAGVIGCSLAWLGVTIGNRFIGGGLQLTLPPNLFALGIGLSLVTGTLGGLYPAWRASRLVPMDAIRLGSH